MMRDHCTPLQARYPNVPAFHEIRTILNDKVVAQMLRRVWDAWEFVQREVLGGVDLEVRANPRVIWPLEAKVLPTSASISLYIKELREAFLTCQYAPFTGEGALLGYLRVGSTEEAFESIAGGLHPEALSVHPQLSQFAHRVSLHVRAVPQGKTYAASFRCHHLMVSLNAGRSA